MRIYLDNCTFDRPFDDQAQIRIRILKKCSTYKEVSVINPLEFLKILEKK